MTYVTAIVVAAGKGRRLRSTVSKPLVEISSLPVIIYSLNIFSKHPPIKEIIIVANTLNQKDMRNMVRRYGIAKIKDIILGAKTRQGSVRNALKIIDSRSNLVLIHDAVRPFIDSKIVSALIAQAQKSGAAVVGVPVKATIKEVRSQKLEGRSQKQKVKSKFVVQKTIDRENLWEIQTPQVFKKGLILEAYRKFGNTLATDDAMLVEKLGCRVNVVPGAYDNIKITTAEDLVVAEAILKSRKS